MYVRDVLDIVKCICLFVRKVMDVYEHERLSNITHGHKLIFSFCRMQEPICLENNEKQV